MRMRNVPLGLGDNVEVHLPKNDLDPQQIFRIEVNRVMVSGEKVLIISVPASYCYQVRAVDGSVLAEEAVVTNNRNPFSITLQTGMVLTAGTTIDDPQETCLRVKFNHDFRSGRAWLEIDSFDSWQVFSPPSSQKEAAAAPS